MQAPTRNQLLLIGGALVLFVLLFFANRKAPPGAIKNGISQHAGNKGSMTPTISFDKVINQSKKGISANQKRNAENLETQLKQADQQHKIGILKTMVAFWDSLKKPEVAAYYSEQIANISNTAKDWYTAGDHYYKSTGFIKKVNRPAVFQRAIDCLNKSIAKDSTNLDAQVDLGVCYVEGTGNPMKGIMLIRNVLQRDSNNINGQLNLGLFSVKSGQLDKAIYRFKRVLQIDPTYLEAYLFMSDTYEKMGNKPDAIAALKKYASLVNDPSIKADVEKYINKLENN